MGVGRGSILKFDIFLSTFLQKWVFSWFRVVKIKFCHFWLPLQKYFWLHLENLLLAPPWKNPSDAHARIYKFVFHYHQLPHGAETLGKGQPWLEFSSIYIIHNVWLITGSWQTILS